MFSTLRERLDFPGRNWLSLAFSLVLVDALAAIFWRNETPVANYNPLLDLVQYCLLVLAVAMHGENALRASRTSVNFVVHTGFMWLCCAFLLREIDIDRLGSDPAWTWAWAWLEIGVRSIALAMLLVWLWVLAPKLRQMFAARAVILSTPVAVLSILGGAFLVAGWPFDKNMFSFLSPGTSAFIEELLELNGYVLILAGSLANRAKSGRAP